MKWAIDPAHSNVEFAVRYMGLSAVRGRFKRVTGTFETAVDGGLKMIEATIDTTSVDSGEPHRDVHLLSPDFLDAARYPTMRFVSRQIEGAGPRRYRVLGDLTIRGETRPVEFLVETMPPVPERLGWRAGASAGGTLSRREWGVAWNQVLLFGVLVADEVRSILDIQAVAPAGAARDAGPYTEAETAPGHPPS